MGLKIDNIEIVGRFMDEKSFGSGGIRTHASEETGALNQRLRPLGHATLLLECCWESRIGRGVS